MKTKHRIYLVVVFTRSRYSGNPLAVIVSEQPLTAATMQKIAAEMNFLETAFVTDSAAAVCWFIAPPITLGATIEPEAIATAVGLQPQDIDTRTPVQVLDSGTAAIVLPLRDLDALRRGRLDLDRFATLADAGYPPLVYLYCAQTRAARDHISARFFFEAREAREDPATGNGAAFLGAYLLEYAAGDEPELNLRIEQGHELGRPSLIYLRARRLGTGCEIQIGDSVIANVDGTLLGADHAG